MTSSVSRLLALIQPAHKRLFYYSTDGLISRKQTKLRLRLFNTAGEAGWLVAGGLILGKKCEGEILLL